MDEAPDNKLLKSKSNQIFHSCGQRTSARLRGKYGEQFPFQPPAPDTNAR